MIPLTAPAPSLKIGKQYIHSDCQFSFLLPAHYPAFLQQQFSITITSFTLPSYIYFLSFQFRSQSLILYALYFPNIAKNAKISQNYTPLSLSLFLFSSILPLPTPTHGFSANNATQDVNLENLSLLNQDEIDASHGTQNQNRWTPILSLRAQKLDAVTKNDTKKCKVTTEAEDSKPQRQRQKRARDNDDDEPDPTVRVSHHPVESVLPQLTSNQQLPAEKKKNGRILPTV